MNEAWGTSPSASGGAAQRPTDLPLLAIVLGATLALGCYAFGRPIDPDEGVYQYAALRLAGGSIPYHDFVYHQTPYLLFPYLPAGRSLFAARLISVLWGGVALGVFALLVRRRGVAGVVGLLLLATNVFFVAWIPVFKTYALTLAGSLLAFYLIRSPNPRAVFWAGVVLGIVVLTRLLYAPVFLLFGLWMAFPPEGRRGRLRRFLLGAAVASVPALLIALVDPSRFFFGVIGLHASRTPEGLIGSWAQKTEIVGKLIVQVQWIVLIGLAAGGILCRRFSTGWLLPACAVALALVSIAPTPSYPQYFVTVVPFLALLSVNVFEVMDLKRMAVCAVSVLGVYLYGWSEEYDRHMPETALRRELVEEVSECIRRRTQPGEEILAFWPGYAVFSGTVVPHGLENNDIFRWKTLSDEQKRSYHILTAGEVEEGIRRGRFRVVQFGGHVQEREEVDRLRRLAESSGYRAVYGDWGRFVHVRDDPSTPKVLPAPGEKR